MKKIFLTGATGFLGKASLGALLAAPDVQDVYALIRNKSRDSKKLADLAEKAENLGKKLTLMQGDIELQDLGLTKDELNNLLSCEEVYHFAARVSLSNEEGKKDSIFRTNVAGTKNLLDTISQSVHLTGFYFFSSAYACGRIDDIIPEDWFELPASFRNSYEHSKWLAEDVVRVYSDRGLPTTVLRPSVLCQNKKLDMNGIPGKSIYQYAYLLKKAFEINNGTHAPIRVLGNPKGVLNLLDLEDFIRSFLAIRTTKGKQRVYNITSPKDSSVPAFLEGVSNGLNFLEGYTLTIQLNTNSLSEAERLVYIQGQPFHNYLLNKTIIWKTDNIRSIDDQIIPSKDPSWIKSHIKEYVSKLK